MKTTIETTDYIHQTGLPMVSLKDVVTELPEGWGDGYDETERSEMLALMHETDLEIARYRGLLNEGKGAQDNLDYVLLLLQDADQDACLALSAEIAKDGIDAFVRSREASRGR